MSTPQTTTTVKQALLEKLHQEIIPELQQLIQQLPDQLLDFQQAETRSRQGRLRVAQPLSRKSAPVADLAVQRPGCPQCAAPRRHKGRDPNSVLHNLGQVACRRASR